MGVSAEEARLELARRASSITAEQARKELERRRNRIEPKKNFFQRFGNDLRHRFGEQGAQIINAKVLEDQGYASTALQLVGKVGAGTIVDFLGEALISGGRGLSNITPDFIEDPIKQSATKAGIALLNTDLGQKGLNAAREGIESYQEFATEHPVMARNIEAVVDIGLLVAPVKAVPKGQGIIGRAGSALGRSGIRSAVRNKRAFVETFVTPKQTAKVRQSQVSRTTEGGILNSKKVELTPLQKAGADEVMKTAISPKKTIQGNFNVVRNAVFKETDIFKASLAKTGPRGRFIKQEFYDELDAAFLRLQNNPALVGNSEISAKRVIALMREMVEREKPHVSRLLAARKKFDQKLINEGREKLFDPAMENAMTFALREVRQTTNSFIHKRVPSVGVRKSLDKQSRLLRVLDDVKIKAADEANNAISRVVRNALKVLTLRGEINQTAALLYGVGGMGAAAMFAPFITKFGALGVVTYVAGNLVIRPGARKGLGQLLKLLDRATLKISDPAVLRQIRADRAAIVELLKLSKEQLSEGEK